MHEFFIYWNLVALAITLDMMLHLRISQNKIKKDQTIIIKEPVALSLVVCLCSFFVLFPINFALLPIVLSRYFFGDHDFLMDSIYVLLEDLAKGKKID
jgi:hypothetical protein